jgi:2,3-bisphosphoglycerate-dependent phosphoglycerate mutase
LENITVSFPVGEVNPQYAVTVALWREGWVFVRHGDRATWETPGGHIEPGETPQDAACRELYEETGATAYQLWEINSYRVERDGVVSDGVLYLARIDELGELPPFEMAERRYIPNLADALSIPLTYPYIQPVLFARIQAWLGRNATKVHFIRHAETDYTVRDGRIRPLPETGLRDAAMLPMKLADIPLDALYASPYKRAVDTIAPLAEARNLPVTLVEDFREQVSGDVTVDKYAAHDAFICRCWEDHDYHAPGGESLRMVRERNIAALEEVLREQRGKSVAIGTHGTALCTIVNHSDPTRGLAYFEKFRMVMPYVVRLDFLGEDFLGWTEIPLGIF